MVVAAEVIVSWVDSSHPTHSVQQLSSFFNDALMIESDNSKGNIQNCSSFPYTGNAYRHSGTLDRAQQHLKGHIHMYKKCIICMLLGSEIMGSVARKVEHKIHHSTISDEALPTGTAKTTSSYSSSQYKVPVT